MNAGKYAVLISVLIVGNISGSDGVELLNRTGFIDSVSVTPSELKIKVNSDPSPWGIQVLGKEAQDLRDLTASEELALLPVQSVRFATNDRRITLTPVTFQGSRKGFRVTEGQIGSGRLKPKPVITYVALGDTPADVGESDVEMTMDNGEWVNPADSRSLEIERLGADAEWMIKFADRIVQDDVSMNAVMTDRAASALWRTLIDRGFITPDTSTHESADGMELLKTYGLFESVTVTSASLIVKISSHSPSYWSVTVAGKDQQPPRELMPDELLAIHPDQTVRFGTRGLSLTLTPVSFKSQHRGFRVTQWHTGTGTHRIKPVIGYIVLSDTPMGVGEDDMEMTLDNGEWVKPEDSQRLEIEKLGWTAETMIKHSERRMQNPDEMASLLGHWASSNLWNLLVEKGLIKYEKPQPVPKAENDAQETSPVRENPVTATLVNIAEDGQDEEKSKANMFWLGVVIFHCLLAILWLARKKRKRETKN